MAYTCRGSYPEGLAVGPDVGRGPVGQALDVQGLSLVEAAFLGGLGPVVEQAVHLQQLSVRQRSLDTHPVRETSIKATLLTQTYKSVNVCRCVYLAGGFMPKCVL